MQLSTDRIISTHTGSLPRTPAVVDLLFKKERGVLARISQTGV